MIRRRGRLLLAKRQGRGLLGGFWELPGGSASSVRSVAALVREQTGLAIGGLARAGVWEQTFSHFRLELTIYACSQVSGCLALEKRAGLRWTCAADRERLPLVTLHRRALAAQLRR